MYRQWHGIMFVLVSAVSFGLMPIFARFAYRNGVGVQELLFMRFVLAVLLTGISLRVTGKLIMPQRNHLLILFALGGIGYYLQSTFYFTALLYVPVSVVALVLYTYPAFVTVCSLVLGWEKFSVSVVLSLLLALLGLVLVANPIIDAAATGILIALGAPITYTAYILVSKRVLEGLSGEVGSFYVMGSASLSFGISGLATGGLHLAWNVEAWIWVIMIGLISTSLAAAMFFKGLKLVGPSRASILSTAELITSVVAASIIFDELLSVTQLIGGLLILLATALASLASYTSNRENSV
ncbi:MAG: DMT family transporter [Candidatus Bathyarchaeota archaeon]|nr:DMT family transporter [Candidatus Bathyarchaeota archaeon]